MSGDDHEAALLTRVAAFRECPNLELLSEEKLQEIAVRQGLDFATALLYDRVKRSERHSEFIARIDELQQRDFPNGSKQSSRKATIAIAPAAFYKEKPNSGADGRVVREAAKRMGIHCELIPFNSTGTLTENSTILLDWLKDHTGEKTILVSLCKGGADVKFALGAPGAETRFGNVPVWVNICGTLNGSPFAQWLLATRLRSFAIKLLLNAGGHNLRFLKEISPSSTGPLSDPLRLVPTMQLLTIVGFPLRRHLTNGFMRRCHKFISPRGPNDGGVVLADACHLPGLIYPIWGADHYLRPDDRAQRILSAVFDYLTSEPQQAAMARNPRVPCQGNQTLAIDQNARKSLA